MFMGTNWKVLAFIGGMEGVNFGPLDRLIKEGRASQAECHWPIPGSREKGVPASGQQPPHFLLSLVSLSGAGLRAEGGRERKTTKDEEAMATGNRKSCEVTSPLDQLHAHYSLAEGASKRTE